jgi:hypothetical protein
VNTCGGHSAPPPLTNTHASPSRLPPPTAFEDPRQSSEEEDVSQEEDVSSQESAPEDDSDQEVEGVGAQVGWAATSHVP